MLVHTTILGLLSAIPALASPCEPSPSSTTIAKRPEVTYGPYQPYSPICETPTKRNKICVVPTNNDGVTDDGPAIIKACQECNNGGQVVLPASSNYYVASKMDLRFLNNIDIVLEGTVLFSNDTTYWQEEGFYLTYQNATTFFLLGGSGLNMYGGGTLNGNGQAWYDLYAQNGTILRPILVGIEGLHDSVFSGINLRQSPQWFHIVANSTNVVFDNINAVALTSDVNQASNTDGWDVYRSSNIVIQNSNIINDDDCVSFKPNATQILVQNMQCTGSHGISVGSLGQYVGEYDIVEDIIVYNASMYNTSTGARIKVWPGVQSTESEDLSGGGGSGRVQNILYEKMFVEQAGYAIQVTQCYGQDNLTLCNEFPSDLTITNVTMIDITGTTSKSEGGPSGYIVCSSETVCSDIMVNDIHVVGYNGLVNEFECGDVDQTLLVGINCTAATST